MHGERAAIKVKVGAETIVHHREHLLTILLVIVLLVQILLTSPSSTAVHEDVLLARVSVEVTVELDLTALQRLPHHLLDGEWLREQLGARVKILAVEVVS